MKEKFLPIGTVVLLKNGEKKVMITSCLVLANLKEKKIFDYGGCPYPEGIADSKVGIGFNHADIKEVVYPGYEDNEYKMFNKLLVNNEEELRRQVNESSK